MATHNGARHNGGSIAFSNLNGSASVAQLGSTSYAAGVITFTLPSVNFNSANTDNAISISLPTGFTRYRISGIFISGASQTLTTATCGLFTATGAGGTAIVTAATAITVTTASADTNTGIQSLTVNGTNTKFYDLATFPTLYFRVQTAQGAAATASVVILINPLP